MPYHKIRRGLLVLAIFFVTGSAIAQSEQPAPFKPSIQNNGISKNEKTPNDTRNITHNSPSIMEFFTTNGLQKISTYCAIETSSKPDKWLQEKFICDVRLTDVAIAIFTGFLVIFTFALVIVSLRQAGLTRDALIHTQRAFVHVSKIQCDPKIDKHTKKIVAWQITIEWTNSGDTPTKNMRSCITKLAVLKNGEIPLEIPDHYDFRDVDAAERPTLMAPKASILSGSIEINPDDIQKMIKRTQRTYIYGWADYNDVFKGTRRHRIEFCNEIIFLLLIHTSRNVESLRPSIINITEPMTNACTSLDYIRHLFLRNLKHIPDSLSGLLHNAENKPS